ncbi:hypothetical protein [Paenibacillus sp. Marseille-Q9583]
MLPSEVINHVKELFPKIENKQLWTQPSSLMDEETQLDFITGTGQVLSHLIVQLKGFMNGENITTDG